MRVFTSADRTGPRLCAGAKRGRDRDPRSLGNCGSRAALQSWALVTAAVGVTVVAAGGCRRQAETPLDSPFTSPLVDAFDGPTLAGWWLDTGGNYRVRDGALVAEGGYNHPLWLRKRLPPDFIVDVDVESRSAAGDIKLELAGDGASFDPDRGGYVSTGYVLIFGGWHNSLSVICRNDEHDAGRKAARSDRPVEPGRRYHFRIERAGGRIDWRIDGAPFLSWTDPEPLTGRGHEYLAFNDWESEVHFDNLSIEPRAPSAPVAAPSMAK